MYISIPSFLLGLAFTGCTVNAQSEPISVLLDRGNDMLSQGRTSDALTIFSAAIEKDTSNYLTYFKRATTYLAMSRHSAALGDFNRVLTLKPDFTAALAQRGKVMASLGHWDAALDDLQNLKKDYASTIAEIGVARKAAKTAEQAFANKAAQKCLDQSAIAINTASASSSLRRLRAKCSIMIGEADSAISDLVFASRVNPSDAEVQMLSANLFFFALSDPEKGISQLKTCLHYDPDAQACKKSFKGLKKLSKLITGVRSARDSKKWVTAKKALKGSADSAGLLQQLADERERLVGASVLSQKLPLQLLNDMDELACEVYAETKVPEGSARCDAALASNPDSVTSLRSKATILLKAELYQEAIDLLTRANEISGGHDNDVRERLQRAHKMLKISKQKDYYKILGVSRDADNKTIKKRYRTLTKEFHPDKYHGEMSAEQVVKKIESINEAYEVLSNAELRQRFDNGDDPNAPPEQQHNPFAHHGFQQGSQFFQQGNPFQGGGGSFKFSF